MLFGFLIFLVPTPFGQLDKTDDIQDWLTSRDSMYARMLSISQKAYVTVEAKSSSSFIASPEKPWCDMSFSALIARQCSLKASLLRNISKQWHTNRPTCCNRWACFVYIPLKSSLEHPFSVQPFVDLSALISLSIPIDVNVSHVVTNLQKPII